MVKYSPITDEERAKILRLHGNGALNSEIALEVERSNSTISKLLQAAGRPANRIGTRKLKRINELNARRRQDLKKQREPDPMAECYQINSRPAAIVGPDLLLERMKTGAR